MFVCFHYKSVNCLFLCVLIALRDFLTEIRLAGSKRPSLYKTGRLHAYA